MAKKQAGKQQAPVQRAISFNSPGLGLAGTLYANDFGRGAADHQLEGYLYDSEGKEWLFRGLLQGVEFVPKETRGAPKKTGRNVAVYLASVCLRQGARRAGIVRFSVLENLRELWADLPTDDRSLRRLIQDGKKATGDSRVVFAGVAIAALWRHFEQQEDGGFTVRGDGWRWAPDMAAAQYGDLLLRVRVRQGQE